MPAFLKKFLVGIGKILAVLAVLFSFYVIYSIYAEGVAKRKSLAMCQSIAPNSETTGLRERALADGASEWQSRWHTSNGVDELTITYTGAPPFSRHICWVKAKNGRVLSVDLKYLD
jgi:hypothetical protein